MEGLSRYLWLNSLFWTVDISHWADNEFWILHNNIFDDNIDDNDDYNDNRLLINPEAIGAFGK